MKISIIIINKNDWGVRDTLHSIAQFIKKGIVECVLVDASNHQLDALKDEFPWVKWIEYLPTAQTKSTIPEQRNIGIQHAKGDIIVFLDASCEPVNKTWLQELTKPIVSEAENIVRGSVGNIQNHVQITETDGARVYVTEAPTINIALRHQVFQEIGNFDESFSYGSDMDFTWRATHAGFKIRYIETAPVTHDFGSTNQNVKRYINYGKARVKLYFNHPYYVKRMLNYELKSLSFFFLLILTPLVFWVPVYTVIPVAILSLHIQNRSTKDLIERVVFGYGFLLGLKQELLNRWLKH